MASQELVYDVVLDTKKAVGDIKEMLAKTKGDASNAGANAGNAFGKQMKTALTGVVSTISFGFLARQVQGLFNQFTSFSNANIQLAGAVRGYNQREQERTKVLNDSTASIEQKAMAIGIDTSQMYENTKATQTNQGAIKKLTSEIRIQENAFDALRRSKEEEIRATEKKRDLEIAEIRRQKGFAALTEEEMRQEKELSDLEIARQTARLAGDFNLATELQNQIDLMKVEKSITDEKLKQIDAQTDKVEDLYKVQITALRTELEASKNKFDIDIEPAKRKLEELRASSVSVGGGQVLKKGILDEINAAAKEAPKQLRGADFNALREELFKKYQGIIPRDALTGAIADLIKGGVTEISEVDEVINRFVDIAAAGKSPFISMGEAVRQLGEQFRSERSELGETAGLTEEYISDLLPRGLAILQAQGKLQDKNVDSLNEEERAMAKRAGLLSMTADRQGIFNDKQEDGLLAADEARAKFEEMSLAIALALGPMLLKLAELLDPVLDFLLKLVQDNPQLIAGLVLAATAFTGLVAVIAGLLFLLPAIKVGLLIVAGVLGLLTSPIGLVTAGIIWMYKNLEWFRDLVDTALSKITGWFSWAKDNWIEALGQVIGFLISMMNPLTWVGYFVKAVTAIFNYLRGVNWGEVWNGIKVAAEGVLKSVGEFFKNFNWKGLGNGFRDFLVGLLKGLGNGIPGSESIINPLIDKIPKFATGGQFIVGGNMGTDKNLVQFMATRGERVTVETPLQQQNSNINSNNESNITNIIYTTQNLFIPTFMTE